MRRINELHLVERFLLKQTDIGYDHYIIII